MSEKGGTGFPTLMFLDAEGRRLMKHSGARSPKGFEEALVEVEVFQVLAKKAAGGDEKAATQLLIRQLRLGWYDYAEAHARVEDLAKVSAKEKKELAQLLTDTEVRTTAAEAGRDPGKRHAAGKHFHEMWKAKRVPAAEAELYTFWFMMADFAEREVDKKLFKKIAKEFKDALKRNPRYGRSIKRMEERLEDFPKKK